MKNKEKKKIYIIGIEGAGTSALALIYKGMGYDVSGSDNGDHFYGDILKRENIKVFPEYSEKNIPKNVDLVVYSTAVGNDNVELRSAKKTKVEILSYPEALAEIFNEKVGIAVCGTHGKTTTTAMLASVLHSVGKIENALVGSKVIDWQGNSLVKGKGDCFVIEADEYQNKLKYYNPWSVILTGVDYDHPDFYKNISDYKKAFSDFVKKIPQQGFLIYFGDSRNVLDVVADANCQKFSYGFSENNDYRIEDRDVEFQDNSFNGKQFFAVYYKNKLLGEFSIKLFGKHNLMNATAVIALCHKLGIDLSEIEKALANFSGTARRLEYIGKYKGVILLDDYAHHPEEIKITLETIRKIYPNKKINAIFHPHSFTRTEALLEEFAQSFGDATRVFLLDIYGSAREKSGNVNSRDLVAKINGYSLGDEKAIYIGKIDDMIKYLTSGQNIGEEYLIVSLGAGDVWRVTHFLANKK